MEIKTSADLFISGKGNEAGPVDIEYTVTLSTTNDTGAAITFDLDDLLTGTATSGSDDTAIGVSAQISVLDGASTGTLIVPVLDDAFFESTETVDADISNSSNSAVTIGTSTATANISDDELGSLNVGVVGSTASVDEGNFIQGEVTRTGDTTSALVVTLTSGDTGELVVPVTVTIAAGDTLANFPIEGIQDFVVDGDQPVSLQADGTGYQSGSNSILVLDVTPPTELTVTIDATAVTEAGASATGTVQRTGPFIEDLTVALTTDPSSRLVIPATVVIPSGSASATFPVQANDDDLVNGDETILVTASTQPPIAFDTTFRVDGAASISAVENEFFYLPTSGEHLIQDDGKVVTSYNRQVDRFNVVRFNSDGSPDLSFGNRGIISYDHDNFVSIYETPGDIVQLPSGKLVVSFVRGPVAISPLAKQYLLQLNTDGSIDTSFGDLGIVEVDATVRGFNSDLVALSDGSIVAVSTRRVNSVEITYAKRILPDGTIDPNYDDSAVAGMPQGTEIIAPPDDSVVLAERFHNGTTFEGRVVKLLPGGGADPSFGNGGVVTLSAPTDVYISDLPSIPLAESFYSAAARTLRVIETRK